MADLIYLASPYTGTKAQMQERYELACEHTAFLMRQGFLIFSPIAHSHGPAQYGLPKDYQYWRTYCEAVLPRCDQFWILTLDGWRESVGIQAETELAERHKIDVHHVTPIYDRS